MLKKGRHVFVAQWNQFVETGVEVGAKRRGAEHQRDQRGDDGDAVAPGDQGVGRASDERFQAGGDMGGVHGLTPEGEALEEGALESGAGVG